MEPGGRGTPLASGAEGPLACRVLGRMRLLLEAIDWLFITKNEQDFRPLDPGLSFISGF